MMTNKKHNDPLAMVAELMKAMEQPIAQGWYDERGMGLGLDLIREEYKELDFEYRMLTSDCLDADVEKQTEEQFVKELADLICVCYWTAARIGIDINEVFRRVHESNMSKLDPATGKALKRVDGKVLKGENYHLPKLADLVSAVPVTL